MGGGFHVFHDRRHQDEARARRAKDSFLEKASLRRGLDGIASGGLDPKEAGFKGLALGTLKSVTEKR